MGFLRASGSSPWCCGSWIDKAVLSYHLHDQFFDYLVNCAAVGEFLLHAVFQIFNTYGTVKSL